MTGRPSRYTDEVDQAIFALGKPPLKILVWGPGESSKPEWRFEKRRLIVDTLTSNSGGTDDVLTSEELIRSHTPIPLDPGYVELIHANKADVIIALVMASPREQGGVFRELEIIAPHPHIREKVWIFLPNEKSWRERFQAGMLQVYREHQKIELNWGDLQQCALLRSICISKVEEERRLRLLDRLQAEIRGGASR